MNLVIHEIPVESDFDPFNYTYEDVETYSSNCLERDTPEKIMIELISNINNDLLDSVNNWFIVVDSENKTILK